MVCNLLDDVDPFDDRKKATYTQILIYLHSFRDCQTLTVVLGLPIETPCTGLKTKESNS